MKVIVASLPKTGTKSIAEALRVLGYQVDDVLEQYQHHYSDWQVILSRGYGKEEFYEMYKEVDAVTDMPACLVWQEIHQAFPEAKVILTMRENEEVWLKSFKKQITVLDESWLTWLAQKWGPTTRTFLWMIKTAGEKFSGLNTSPKLSFPYVRIEWNDMLLKNWYRKHNSHVIQATNKDNLLILDLSEGWEPLCRFLQKPVPDDVPFPHLNKNSSLLETVLTQHPVANRLHTERMISLYGVCIALPVCIACIMYFKPFQTGLF